MAGSSPPAASGSPMEGFLTPRSKVAKMLADIDDEIENAPTPSPSNRVATKSTDDLLDAEPQTESLYEPAAPSSFDPEDDASNLAALNNDSGTESDGSDDAVRLPQGRGARRMLGGDGGAAPDRPSSARTSSANRSNPSYSPDDEDDLYSATPLKQSTRTVPIASSPLDIEQGNGLFVSPSGSMSAGGERGNRLFVSPAKSTHAESEDELPLNPFGGKDKLAELVAQKRAERLAKEAEEAERRKNASSTNVSSDLPAEAFEGANEPADPNIERIMSDATRPSRKASKKAMLDLERETQRLAREQALAHQMKVKKKFTTNDLFAKFNFRQPSLNVVNETTNRDSMGDSTASSAPNSDGVEERTQQPASTPPSSPPTPLDKQKELADQGALSKLVPIRQDSIASLAEVDDDEELPDMAEVLKSSQMTKATAVAPSEANISNERGLKIARLGKKAASKYDSDDELDIVPSLPARLRAFEKVKGTNGAGKPSESRAIHNLKHLSHLHSDDGPQRRKGAKPAISARALEIQLRKQAKEQARKQQFERIEELKAKGIDVQTAEEREKEAEAFENLLEKARQDAVELRKAEKAARKGAGLDEGATEASEDEDEDEDFQYDGSGSEDEEMDGDEEPREGGDGLIDEAAEETDEEEEDPEGTDDELSKQAEAGLPTEDAEMEPEDVAEDVADYERDLDTPAPWTRVARKSRIIMDDEDESDADADDLAFATKAPEQEDDPFAAFNFGNADALLSPTQAFHATMETPTQASQEDSFDFLRHVDPPSAPSLPPSLPDLDAQGADELQLGFVVGSQVPESQRISLNWETQPPETPVPAGLNRGTSALSETPGWEPSQDAGLPSPWSVGPRRASIAGSIDEHETQSTVRLRVSESPAPSQSAPRRGKLGRRQVALNSESEDEDVPAAPAKEAKNDAFREMARRRKEALTAAELAEANKEMRGMMDEQAEESEDEYAGLGGDDFVAPETEEDKEMIDSSHVEVDERALAAHFAERERIRNEEETSRLYKDLTTGVLRRKMGANAFDLEEDEDELAARRRQMRQQEEARKRKALLKDVNIATLADGKQSKGKDAFLKAIADDEGDDDIVNISDGEDDSVPATQDEIQVPQSQQSTSEPLHEISKNKRTRPRNDEMEDRPPAKQRRTQSSAFRRPTSLLEVQESVSFLLEEPHAGPISEPKIFDLSSESESDYGAGISDDEDIVTQEADRLNDGGFAPNPASMDAKIMPPPRLPASQRRSAPRSAVVDRLSLKRVASASDSAHGRTAWAAGPTTGGFKVPSLLRRATTNIASGANERGITTPPLSRENSGVKMGGTKKSSLAYQARAEERKAIVEASAKRREENTARIAQLRRNSSALNRGLTGRFE